MISRWQAGIVSALILLGGYAVADALDVVPGVVTFKDAPADPVPQPSAGSFGTVSPALPAAPSLGLTTEEVEAAALGLENDDRNTGNLSFIVADPATGEFLYTLRSETPKLPASNMKIVTAAAALIELGPNTTLPTRAVLEGDQLYLVGGGDILLSPTVGSQDLTVGRAGLANLAEDTAATLKDLGISQVALAVDSSLFTGPGYHENVQGSDQVFIMNLRPIAVNGGVTDGRRVLNPDMEAGEIFAAALESKGIQVVGRVSSATSPTPTDTNTVGVVYSAPVRDLVDTMLTASDNSVAETLGHLVAISRGKSADFKGAADATYEVLAQQGWNLTNVTVSDNSGLSIDNRITASLVTEILLNAMCTDCELASIASGMPTAGLSGTLAARFTESDTRGLIHAKTGTLIMANSLSGYGRTHTGAPFVFSVLIDDLETGTTQIVRPAIDEAIAKIASDDEN